MPVVGRYGLVRREQWLGIETEGKGHSTAAEVAVECGGMMEDLMVQKRYGVEVEIEGQLVAEIEGPSEFVHCREMAEGTTVQKMYGVAVAIEELSVEELSVEVMSGLSERGLGAPSLREGRHR